MRCPPPVSIIDARGSRRVLLGALLVASALCSTVARGHAQPLVGDVCRCRSSVGGPR